MKAKYLMITSWDNYWDKVASPYYTKGMFREGMCEELIEENAGTIFIKSNRETKKPEKAWQGTVYNFKREGEKIYFNVRIENEIPVPQEYIGKSEGWYFIGEERVLKEEGFPLKSVFYPPFFYILRETKDWRAFENYTYYLLKLIGISDIYKFENQRGLPDGFFKLGRLAVIYDCTLEENLGSKKAQIDNYCSQLSSNYIEVEKNKIPIKDCSKEVWIITKRRSNIIEMRGELTVKEVSINSLFELYYSRIKEISGEIELEEKLRGIGK